MDFNLSSKIFLERRDVGKNLKQNQKKSIKNVRAPSGVGNKNKHSLQQSNELPFCGFISVQWGYGGTQTVIFKIEFTLCLILRCD